MTTRDRVAQLGWVKQWRIPILRNKAVIKEVKENHEMLPATKNAETWLMAVKLALLMTRVATGRQMLRASQMERKSVNQVELLRIRSI